MGIDAVMVVRVLGEVSDERIEATRYRMVDVFGADRFIQYPASAPGSCGCERRALMRNPADGAFGRTVLDVSLMGRYYGPGYERGDPAFLVELARFLEASFEGAEVYYGGDDELRSFGEPERLALMRHAREVGHEPYQRRFGRDEPEVECSFCRRPMVAYSWNPEHVGYGCLGCDERAKWYKATGKVARARGGEER